MGPADEPAGFDDIGLPQASPELSIMTSLTRPHVLQSVVSLTARRRSSDDASGVTPLLPRAASTTGVTLPGRHQYGDTPRPRENNSTVVFKDAGTVTPMKLAPLSCRSAIIYDFMTGTRLESSPMGSHLRH